MELLIDTSTRYAAVGLSEGGECVAEIRWRSARNHSVELIPAVNRALAQAGRGMDDLSAVFAASGPGGFSALRVGMSAAKAIAAARGIPLVAVGTLDIEIQPFAGLGAPVCAVVGAGRNRLYVGTLNPSDGEAAASAELQSTDEFLAGLSPEFIYCGEAVGELAGEMRARLGGSLRMSLAPPPSRGAAALARLGYAKLAAGDTADAASAEPLYLRSSQVSSAERARRAAGR